MERDLKEYIVKLNDRNIQRQRETGFTLYAILGAIIFCFFFLIDNLSIFSEIINNNNHLDIAIIISNSLFILFFLYLAYETTTSHRKLTKIFPSQQPLTIEFVDIPLFIALILISFLNFLNLNNSQNISHYYYLLIFGIIAILNILLPFIIKVFSLIKRKRKKKKGLSVEIIDFTTFDKKTIKAISFGFLSYTIILTVLSIILLSKVKFDLDTIAITAIIKYTIIFFGLLFLIKTSINIKSKQNDNNQLEDFEKEIFFEDLKNEEISKRFEREFAGVPFSKWITNKHIEIMNFFDTKRQEFLGADLLIIDVDNVDKNKMKHEYIGRLNDIIKKQLELLNDTNDFVQRIRTTFSNLKNFGSLNDDEVQQLNFVYNFLKNSILGFNNQYRNLSKKIADRQE